MDPSSGQHHHQEMSSQTLESMLACTKVAQQDHKKPRPQDEAAPNCPRCDSTNTKFCYYNNYSLSQPRYFCKSCRRYWTKGGTLRNVPVGGGCRKNNKRSSAKRSSQDSANNQISSYTQLPYDNPNDLTLAFARLQNQESVQLIDHISPEFQRTIRTEAIFNPEHVLGNRAICTPSAEVVPTTGLLDALRGGFLETPNGFFHHNNNLYYGSGGHNMGHVVENGDHMATHLDQEMRSGVKEEILWGYPWQMNMNGENGNMMSEFESSRQRLNGFGVPSWHGLVNSPLM